MASASLLAILVSCCLMCAAAVVVGGKTVEGGIQATLLRNVHPITTAIALLTLLPALACAGEAVLREATLEIPTYGIGPADRNPPLWNGSVYPYPMQTEIAASQSTQPHRAVILENEFIRVIILPDLGGRIYAAHDKTNHDFDFIYHNHVIKPGLVALRGAWLSGGIEWNFPTRGHTVNTVAPVKYVTSRSTDGSVTCVVGTSEWVRRMGWSVAITMPPDEARFTYRIRLANPTLTHNNAYFWANAAVHAWNDTRVVFPPATYTFAGRRADPRPWPMVDGRDVSWYRNTPYPYDYFCGSTGEFQAAYNHERDNGSVCCADRLQSMGRKFWTWGTARGGMIWEDILTDRDGQYIEVQSGRLPTQGDTWIFEPHRVETWEESWYPVKGMGGLVKANSAAALNFSRAEGNARMALYAPRSIAGSVQLSAGGTVILDEKLKLEPAGIWKKQVPLPADARQIRLLLRDERGRELIAYEPDRREEIPPPQLEPQFPPDDKCSAEQLYLKGYYAQKHWRPEDAVRLFEKALAADPGFTRALTAMAIHYYKTGRFEKSLEMANRTLERNDDDLQARYYRVLAKMRLGIPERIDEDIELLGRRSEFVHVAPYLAASLAASRGDWQRTRELLHQAHSPNGDGRAEIMLAAILRRLGNQAGTRACIDQVLRSAPLCLPARVELALQGHGEGLDLLRDDPQEYLEAAWAYAEMNLWEDAAATLGLFENRKDAPKHPFVSMALGYLAHRAGREDSARQQYGLALALTPDYVFPCRTEEIAVLQAGLRYYPDHWKLHYYLGIYLAASMRWREGLEHLQAAEMQASDYAPVFWSLGEIYREKLQDLEKAQAAYERAVALRPTDCAYYLILDQTYAARGLQQKREAMFKAAPATVASDDRVLLRKAIWHVDMGQWDQALAILRAAHFHPWEGWSGARDVFVRALRLRAEEHVRKGNYEDAVKDLTAAKEYPENLGSGRPHDPSFAYEDYHLGMCYKAMGKAEEARRSFRSVGVGSSPWHAKADEELRKLARQ